MSYIGSFGQENTRAPRKKKKKKTNYRTQGNPTPTQQRNETTTHPVNKMRRMNYDHTDAPEIINTTYEELIRKETTMIPDVMAAGLLPEAEDEGRTRHVEITKRALREIYEATYIPTSIRTATMGIMSRHIEGAIRKLMEASVPIVRNTIKTNADCPVVQQITLAMDQLAPNIKPLNINRVKEIANRMMKLMTTWHQQGKPEWTEAIFDPQWPEVQELMGRSTRPKQNLIQLLQIWQEIMQPRSTISSLRSSLTAIADTTTSLLRDILRTATMLTLSQPAELIRRSGKQN